MIYKKKHIIKEALIIERALIDDITTFTNKEKRVLKTLYKQYYKPNDPGFRWWKLNSYEIAEDLIEKWQFSYEIAYKLSKVFVLYGEQLFRDNTIVSEYPIREVLRSYLSRFFEPYRKRFVDDVINDGAWNIKLNGEVFPYVVRFWDSYNGFNLYLTIDRNFLETLPRQKRYELMDKYILIKCRLDFEVDEPTISITYTLGDDGKEMVIIDKAIIDLPRVVNEQEIFVWLDDLVSNQIRAVVEDFEFS